MKAVVVIDYENRDIKCQNIFTYSFEERGELIQEIGKAVKGFQDQGFFIGNVTIIE